MRDGSKRMRAGAWCLAAMVLAACGSAEREEPDDLGSAAAAPDAMCAEHGVLESLCTQCNPALVPVFRARGDYCEEHGLPESICPTCHPERGGRPSVELATDDAPADGTRVRLASPELAARIGLRAVEITAAPDVVEIAATARITYDATRVARLNARSPGVIRELHADIGARVAPGDPLVTIASAEVAADRTRLAAARTRLEVADSNLARREGLGDIVSQRDLLEARRERDDARAELSALQASVRAVGGRRSGSEYVLTSPLGGVVTHRTGSIGSFVDGHEMLVEVVDPSRVWLELEVAEADVARVRAGLPVRIEIDGLAGTREGTLDYLAPEIDARTRTTRGRVSLDNTDGALRANTYARAVVLAPRDAPAWRVPRASVQRARGATLVFVRVADELYEARRVEIADDGRGAEHVDVRGRLEAGERVVVDAAFLLRTETLRDSIGAGCCEGEEAGR